MYVTYVTEEWLLSAEMVVPLAGSPICVDAVRMTIGFLFTFLTNVLLAWLHSLVL